VESLRFMTAHNDASAGYRPEPYPGRLTVFTAGASEVEDQRRSGDAWTALAGGVDRHVLPGDHFSLLAEPNVATLATLLREAIARAIARD
jgi:thioesterase domain-containing protein